MTGFPLFDGSIPEPRSTTNCNAFSIRATGRWCSPRARPNTCRATSTPWPCARWNASARVGSSSPAPARNTLRGLPNHVLQRAYAPLGALLPSCAGLVHPGGIGAMSLALAAGVPQVLLPCAHDQFDNAERLVRLGCGMRLGVPLREQELRGALWRLLEDPAMAAACRRFMELSQPHSIACGKAAQVVERCHREGDARWLKAAS